MLTLTRSQLSNVCFDVGGSGMRVCQARRRRANVGLCDSLQVDVGAMTNATSLDLARVARAMRQGRFRGRDVTLVLSPPAVSFFPLQLPAGVLTQPADRLETAIRWEVSRGMREAAEAIEVRWWKIPHPGPQQPNFMVVAMHASLARACHDQLQRFGLSLARIMVSPCALLRAARSIAPPIESEIWGVLDMGLRQSTLTMIVEDVPVYVRSLPIVGPAWTRRIADALGVSPDLAETLKRRYGIAPGERGVRSSAGIGGVSDDEMPRVLFNVLRPALDALVQEVLDSFAYVYRNVPDSSGSRLWLAGGGAELRGLADYLTLACSSPVTPLSSEFAESTDCPPPSFTPRSAACVGAALLETDARE